MAAAAAASSIEPNSSRETGEKQLGDTVSAAKSTLEQIQRRKQPEAAGKRESLRNHAAAAAKSSRRQISPRKTEGKQKESSPERNSQREREAEGRHAGNKLCLARET